MAKRDGESKHLEPSPKETAAVWVDIDDLKVWDANPRDNDKAVDSVAQSIRRFGFASPIIARQADGEVIAGHTRLKAARQLGLTRVPVRYMDLDPADAHMLALADNRVAEIAEWDQEALAGVLRDLADDGMDLEGLGWSSEELEGLLGDAPEPLGDTTGDDDVPEAGPEPESRPGEVYELGPHRLVCGDSTDAGAWSALMGGEKADAMWTDPPYGVAYVGKTADAMTIQNDKLDNDGLLVFLRSVFSMALASCRAGAPWYVAAPAGPRGIPFSVALYEMQTFRQRLAWVKHSLVLSYSDYHYRHEDIYYGYTPGADGRLGRGGRGWYGDNAQTTVLEFDKPSANRDHPTMKPVELVAYCLRNSTKPGEVVVEPFGGSGTTLIAAAKEGRIARLIELDPKYCDVIRKRWTKWARENGQEVGSGGLE